MSRPNKRGAEDDGRSSADFKRVRQREQSETTPTVYPASTPTDFIAPSAITSTSAKRPKIYSCDYAGCTKVFDRPSKLETHSRTHTNERPFTCDQEGCDKTFQRREHLTRHVKERHSGERPHVCTYIGPKAEVCGKSFPTAAKLNRHVAAHEEKEQTKCSEPGCGLVFRKQETLQRHIRQDHLGEKGFRCTRVDAFSHEQCGQMFDTVGLLKGHEKRVHADTVKLYYCDICTATRGHSAEDNLDTNMINQSAEDIRVSFPTYLDLQAHIKLAHPPTCSECGLACKSTKALKAHKDIEHSSLNERQQYPCDWPGCERAFTKAGNLKVHMQNVHAKIKSYVCGSFDLSRSKRTTGWDGRGCGMALGTKAGLEEHVRTQHLGIPAKIAPSVLARLRARNETPSSASSAEEVATPATDDYAMTMLTGHGYDQVRPVACFSSTCPQRFRINYELALHLELTHGWQMDNINDAIAEREALTGGKFWIGGEEEGLDNELRERLQRSLNLDVMNGTNGMSNALPLLRSEWEQLQGVRAKREDDGEDEAGDPMMIDPLLC